MLGCTNCWEDSCRYQQEKQAIWSEDDKKLGLVIEDLGEKQTKKDNHYFLYTLELDGSNFNKIIETEFGESISYLNTQYQYAILTYDLYYGSIDKYYKQVNFTLGTSTVIANVAGQPCLDYQVIPSLDGAYLARIKIQGQVNEAGTDCHSVSVVVDFIDSVTSQISAQATSINPEFHYSVYEENLLKANFYASWTNTGIILSQFDSVNISTPHAIIETDGTVLEYSKPEGCGWHETSSSIYSEEGTRALVTGLVGAIDAKVELVEGASEENIICN